MNFFLKPDGSVIKINWGTHWEWVQRHLIKEDPKLYQAVQDDQHMSSFHALFVRGWWRGGIQTYGGVEITLETEKFPSKQKLVDAVYDVLTEFKVKPDRLSMVYLDYDSESKSKEYRGSELLGESVSQPQKFNFSFPSRGKTFDLVVNYRPKHEDVTWLLYHRESGSNEPIGSGRFEAPQGIAKTDTNIFAVQANIDDSYRGLGLYPRVLLMLRKLATIHSDEPGKISKPAAKSWLRVPGARKYRSNGGSETYWAPQRESFLQMVRKRLRG